VDGAIRAMSSGAWVASHLFAMLGFILIPLGLLAVYSAVSRTRVERLALAALVITWLGAGLTLPYYGAEDFALNAIATKARQGQVPDLLDLVEAIRFQPAAATTFAVGLLLLGVGAVLVAVAIWRSGVLPRSSGIPFAVGFGLFLPQFYTPPAVRIGHGVLVAAGSIWVALVLWRAQPAQGIAGRPPRRMAVRLGIVDWTGHAGVGATPRRCRFLCLGYARNSMRCRVVWSGASSARKCPAEIGPPCTSSIAQAYGGNAARLRTIKQRFAPAVPGVPADRYRRRSARFR
jgi:hypothetical protein